MTDSALYHDWLPVGKSVTVDDAQIPYDLVLAIASFFDIGVEDAMAYLRAYQPSTMADAWRQSNPQTPEEMRQFYSHSEHYIWELAKWNYGPGYKDQWLAVKSIERLFPPERFPVILDYGCGIASVSVYLAQRGYKVTVADVPGRTLDFVRHLARSRQLQLNVVEIVSESSLPEAFAFDILICFDVLEHLPAPDRVLGRLVHRLKTGGAAAMRASFERDYDLPHHLEENWLRFGKTNNWWITVNSMGLDGVGVNLLYRKVSDTRIFLRKLRYWLWLRTSIFPMHVPTGR